MNKKITSIVRQQPKLTGQIGNTLIYIDPNLEDQKVDIVKNGVYTLRANEGFDALNTVEINAEVIPEIFTPFTYTGYNKSYLSNIGHYIKDVPYLDLGDSNSVYYLFYGASKLEHVGTIRSNKDIIYAAYMFYGCTSLKKIDNIDLRLPTVAAGYSLTYACCYMFCNCNNLEGEIKLDMPTTSGNMDAMFYNCYKIKKIDLSSITTTPTAFVNVFANCYELEELDISGMSIPYTPNTHSDSFKNVGKNLSTPTKVYVKDEATQNWILSLSGTVRPSNWSKENVIIKG